MSWKFNPPPGWPPQPEGWLPPPGWAPDPNWPPAPPGWEFWVPADQSTSPSVPPTAAYPPAPYQSPAPAPPTPSPFSPGQPPSGQPYFPGGSQPQSGYPGAYHPPGYPAPDKPWYQKGWVIALGAGALVLLTALVGVGTFIALRPDDETPDRRTVTASSPTPGVESPSPAPPEESPDDPVRDRNDAPGTTIERFEGEGSREISLTLDKGTYYTLHLDYRGSDLWELSTTEAGDDLESLAWGFGDYNGTYALNLFHGENPDGIRIRGSGSWTMEIYELSASPTWPQTYEGTGSEVVLVEPGSKAITVTGQHDGVSNFIVWAYVEDGFPSLLFNEIGLHEGSAVVPPGTFAISIVADGNWVLQPE